MTAVAGVVTKPLRFLCGAAGGGVWKTEDAGLTWENLSDGYFKTGSVGALAVAESNPDVVYAGLGEAQIRGAATSHGDGVYRSNDGGGSWQSLGLEKTRQISRVRIDPQDPDRVYVAAQGSPWTPNPERGIYRSCDGGQSWDQVLFVDKQSGASDLCMDPSNPRTLYAAVWDHQRLPWKIRSGGEGSGIHKTEDGGDSWQQLSRGLPELMGKIGIAVSPARPQRVWAVIEAEEGGLYRSEDAGRSWRRVNEERLPMGRAWYFTKVVADPRDADTVYVLHDPLLKSADGGRSFSHVATPHTDHHDLWISPQHPDRMVLGNDGGSCVSLNGGKTWSTQDNQPTGQFYRVIADERFPYHLYGAQQDRTTVAIASHGKEGGIGRKDWYTVGGCENAQIALDPGDPSRVYASCCSGIVTEYERETQRVRNIMAYPRLALGSHPRDLEYRFNWNVPIIVSRHDPRVLYHAANLVFRSRDRGLTWQEISPDLTRCEVEKQGPGGGPITDEAAGAETYNTITCLAESPFEASTLWAGTDDGLVHLTRDAGTTWRKVTPPRLGEALVNSIEASPHDPATAYLAVNRHKFGDFTPLVFVTEDFGAHWECRSGGISEEAFVRAVREDPACRGLLYAGTETGTYFSLDGGRDWRSLQLNLPAVPVTDLTVAAGDLVASTEGRGFWILDDLTPLQEIKRQPALGQTFLCKPRRCYRVQFGERPETVEMLGENPPEGATLHYYLSPDAAAHLASEHNHEIQLEILDEEGKAVRSLSGRCHNDSRSREQFPLPVKAGMNRFIWDLRCQEIKPPSSLFPLPVRKSYRVGPGTYQVRLTVGRWKAAQSLEVADDPRRGLTRKDFEQQQSLLADIWEHLGAVYSAAAAMEDLSRQAQAAAKEHSEKAEVVQAAAPLLEKIRQWEEEVIQKRQKDLQDFVRFPHRLDAQLLFLMIAVDSSGPPVGGGALKRFADLKAEWSLCQAQALEISRTDVPAFNAIAKKMQARELNACNF